MYQNLVLGSLVALAASFHPEPVFIKGGGTCEGVECADLDSDGKLDIVSGVPRGGQIHFSRNTGTAQKPSFAERVVLSDARAGTPIKLHHW